jgi:hypothetical protein
MVLCGIKDPDENYPEELSYKDSLIYRIKKGGWIEGGGMLVSLFDIYK